MVYQAKRRKSHAKPKRDRYIFYREIGYVEQANRKSLDFDLFRQKKKLERGLQLIKDHEEYYFKLALLTNYEIALKNLETYLALEE